MQIRHIRAWGATALIGAVVLASAVTLRATVFTSGTGEGPSAPRTTTADLGSGQASASAAQTTLNPAVSGPVTASAAAAPASVSAQPASSASAVLAGATYRPAGFTVVQNLPYTAPVDCGSAMCQIRLDVFVPSGIGPFPTVVLIRGGPSGLGGRSYLDSFAGALANLGILVFNADYRDEASQGGGFPSSFQDVACAIRFARSEAGRYDGIASRVTLVGHSLGGWVGSVVALDPTEIGGGCLDGGFGRPDAFVGLAGNYKLDASEEVSDLYTFFGGYASETAQARAASDPFNYATGTRIPVRLVAGTSDGTVNPAATVALNEFLANRGWDVGLTMVPGATHMSILQIDGDGVWSVRAIFSALAAAQTAANTPLP